MPALTLAIVIAFCIGYLFIAIESVTKVNKAAVALLMLVVTWTLFMVTPAAYLLGVPAALPNGKAIGSVTFTADEAQVGSGKASVTGRNFKMSGTMAALNDAREVYVLDSEGATLTLGTHSVSPFRALFVPISAGTLPPKLEIAIYNTTPSGITDIDDRRDDVEGPVYNLNGQRVSRPGSGIYIVGGRKVVF